MLQVIYDDLDTEQLSKDTEVQCECSTCCKFLQSTSKVTSLAMKTWVDMEGQSVDKLDMEKTRKNEIEYQPQS